MTDIKKLIESLYSEALFLQNRADAANEDYCEYCLKETFKKDMDE